VKRKIIDRIIQLALVVLGRRLAVRVSRALARAARLDGSNDMSSNGELDVQRVALAHARSGSNDTAVTVIDAGANAGEWTIALARTAAAQGLDSVSVFPFEPASATYKVLTRNVESLPASVRVHPIHSALSETSGTATLNIVAEGAGTNSLHVQADIRAKGTETIECISLDEFCRVKAIEHVLLLKIDTEGHEMAVLRGAARMLASGSIELIQFEYNHRWIASRHFLRDAFELLQPLGYRLGKITGEGIEFYDKWHYELETWYEGNYLACRAPWVDRFVTVPWWNA
jgi:FkbM family methyltransferase